MTDRNFVFTYAKTIYHTEPEFLWKNDPRSAILRHKHNEKWFAAILYTSKNSLGLDSSGSIDVLNVKCNPIEIGSLLLKKGFFPAYHMNKKHWISIVLDGSVPKNEIQIFLDESFRLTQ